jgi:hypothetical protein
MPPMLPQVLVDRSGVTLATAATIARTESRTMTQVRMPHLLKTPPHPHKTKLTHTQTVMAAMM